MTLRQAEDYGLQSLLAKAREIWGPDRLELPDIVVRLQVGVGDLARVARDFAKLRWSYLPPEPHRSGLEQAAYAELRKELGNLIFSTIRWCDDLGLSPEECVAAAMEAQQRFAESGRAR